MRPIYGRLSHAVEVGDIKCLISRNLNFCNHTSQLLFILGVKLNHSFDYTSQITDHKLNKYTKTSRQRQYIYLKPNHTICFTEKLRET